MTARSPANLPHSVQGRLRNRARAEGRVYEELLVRHALERFLHRLGQTAQRERFVLKGALLLQVWTGLEARPTRDVDLLGPLGLEPGVLRGAIEECLRADVAPDGWEFPGGEEIDVRPIREGAAYMGLRATFTACLANSRVRMQVDVGSGDDVVPRPERVVLPTLLDQPAPDLLCYSPYASIAEKLDAILVLGMTNSRMKDYFDVHYLAQHMKFDGEILRESIAACCRRRRTRIPRGLPEGLDEEFGRDAVARERWRGFVRKIGLGDHATSWAETVRACGELLSGPLMAAGAQGIFAFYWSPGGPWTGSTDESARVP